MESFSDVLWNYFRHCCSDEDLFPVNFCFPGFKIQILSRFCVGEPLIWNEIGLSGFVTREQNWHLALPPERSSTSLTSTLITSSDSNFNSHARVVGHCWPSFCLFVLDSRSFFSSRNYFWSNLSASWNPNLSCPAHFGNLFWKEIKFEARSEYDQPLDCYQILSTSRFFI